MENNRLSDHQYGVIQPSESSDSFTEQHQLIFNDILKSLVSVRSVFFDVDALDDISDFCFRFLQSYSKNRKNYFDEKGNLISISSDIDDTKPIVYWSAHLDTVDADKNSWNGKLDPFTSLETPTHIIGRGANDCKAGVAQMLMTVATFAGLDDPQYVYLFSRREEGNTEKTSTQIGIDIEKGNLIRSKKSNLMICLENTVKISEKCTLDFYHSEPCNVFIELQGSLLYLKKFSQRYPAWKPVFVEPCPTEWIHGFQYKREAPSGHVATLENNENEIYHAIHHLTDHVVKGGDAIQTSVINNLIRYSKTCDTAINHRSIWNFRAVCEVHEVLDSLSGISYNEYFSIKHSAGSDRLKQLRNAGVLEFVSGIISNKIGVRFIPNPGRSDASAIWNELNNKSNFFILTAGSGTRSHYDAGILRRTHGPNEGFHKTFGYEATDLLLRVGHNFIRTFETH